MKRLLPALAFVFFISVATAFGASTKHAMPPGATPLLPDLRTKQSVGQNEVSALGYKVVKKRQYMTFETRTGNVGRGPFEIQADPMRRLDCDGNGASKDFGVRQVIYHDLDGNRLFRRIIDSWVDWRDSGCIYNHAEHGHWHFDDLNTSFLSKNGQMVSRVQKNSWCLMDMYEVVPGLPGVIEDSFYGGGPSSSVYDNCSSPKVLQGLSPGWEDVYRKGTPGQLVDITKISTGAYCLVTVVDQKGVVLESNENNNRTGTPVYINKEKQVAKNRGGSC